MTTLLHFSLFQSGMYSVLMEKVDSFRTLIGAPDVEKFNIVLLGGRTDVTVGLHWLAVIALYILWIAVMQKDRWISKTTLDTFTDAQIRSSVTFDAVTIDYCQPRTKIARVCTLDTPTDIILHIFPCV